MTFNVSDKNNQSILVYINNIVNVSTGYISNQTKNISITIGEDGNYTFLIEINDSAGNKLNSSFINVVIDTTAPVFIHATNRTTTDNTSTITTATPVNFSIFGVGDIYFDRGNISENCTSSTNRWINHSVTINGNGTYHYVINNENFTAGEVCGEKAYFYDLAGNLLELNYTFTVGSVSSGQGQKGTGAGGFSSPADQIASVTSTMNQELCLQSAGFDWFDDTCYECSGKILKRDEQLLCISCSEGYTLIDNQCKPINSQESNMIKKVRELSLIDKYLDKYFPDNPFLGVLILVSGLGIGIYGFVNRETLIKRFKNGRG